MIELRTPEDRDAAAGEYVLGTLAEADRDAVEAAMAEDAALRAAVYAWQDRLLALSVRTPAIETPPFGERLARSIEAADRSAASTPASAPAPASASPPATGRPAAGAASRPTAPRPRWWQRPAPWQLVSGLAVAASLFLAVLLVGGPSGPPAAGARYLALLQSPEDRATGWIVEIEANRELRLVPVGTPAAAPPGRALQFWTKPKDASAPTSLGLVQAGQALRLPVSRLPGVGSEQLFEITVEPAQGSPTGQPTGPILYVGRTLAL